MISLLILATTALHTRREYKEGEVWANSGSISVRQLIGCVHDQSTSAEFTYWSATEKNGRTSNLASH